MENKTNGKAIAALVLGIFGILLSFWSAALIPAAVGIIVGIVGIVLGVQAKKEAPSGMATAGLVLSIVALALNVIFLIACACAIGMVGAAGGLSSLY